MEGTAGTTGLVGGETEPGFGVVDPWPTAMGLPVFEEFTKGAAGVEPGFVGIAAIGCGGGVIIGFTIGITGAVGARESGGGIAPVFTGGGGVTVGGKVGIPGGLGDMLVLLLPLAVETSF